MKTKNTLLLVLGISLLSLISYGLFVHIKNEELSFIQITCGEGEDEETFRAKKQEPDGTFFVESEKRDFGGCKTKEIRPKKY